MFRRLTRLFSDASEMIFPAVCGVCGRPLVDGETLICMSCDYDMPRCGIESESFNVVHQRLARPGLPIERAASFFYYFRGNPYAMLIQMAKYNNRPSIAMTFGTSFARELRQTAFFNDIDVLLPMPLHFLKKMRRGYNQTEYIARGISAESGIPIGDNLSAARHKSQARLKAVERQKNMEGIIRVRNANELVGQHVLVIDDVITTGATMLSAIKALHQAVPNIRTSVLSLALTKI